MARVRHQNKKAQLIKGTTALLKAVLGKGPSSTFVVIDEVVMEDWGFGGLPVAEHRKTLQQTG